jgi:hypothetical protein
MPEWGAGHPAMSRAVEQARGERAIFGLFAEAACLPIRLRSVRSRPTPEPDIRCRVDGEGHVAFELGEVVYPRFAETTLQRQPLRRRFAEAYDRLPAPVRSALETGLGGPPVVFVSFHTGTSPGRWQRAIPAILAVLAQHAGRVRHQQDLPVWQIPAFKDLVLELKVHRGARASLHVMEMTELRDQTRALLEKKFGRAYRTAAPIELMVYYISQPPPRRDGWRAEVSSFIASHLAGSPFRRVWLFDHFTRSIPLVVPPHEAGQGGNPGPAATTQ